MWSYNYTDELYHHGVKGMKWGHRKARREVLKTARRRAYDNLQSDLAKMGPKADRHTVKKRSAQYTTELKTAKRQYKEQKQRDKIIEKEAAQQYKNKTTLNSRQKKIRTGAVIAASILTTPLGGAAVAYGATSYMRAKNDIAQQGTGTAKVNDILKRL